MRSSDWSSDVCSSDLFDSLGPDARSVDVSAALNALAAVDETERGAVYTRPEVVAAILDLCGYTADRPLHQLCLLEPSFGGGDFLLPALDRLDRKSTRLNSSH